MLNDFWILIVEVWQTGIRGVSINEIVVCILIILGSWRGCNYHNVAAIITILIPIIIISITIIIIAYFIINLFNILINISFIK